MKKLLYLLVVSILAGTTSAWALSVTITDTTMSGATLDGNVGGGEYVGSNTGVNDGFGNVWGSGAALHIDSDALGNVQLGHAGPGFGNPNTAVIYIDSAVGGFSDTTTINDNGDFGRAAISGNGTGSGASEVTFAAGFDADFAIAWDGNGNVNLFSLAAGGSGSLTFVTGLAGSGSIERGFNLSSIGLSAGDSFSYVVSYLNADNAFRSDEFIGTSFGAGNPGVNPVTLSGFSTFNSYQMAAVPEPGTMLPMLVAGLALFAVRRKRAA